MNFFELFDNQLQVVKGFVLAVSGLMVSIFLSACSTQHCDSTGAMASHCTPVKIHVFTGEAFEEDKMFYYRKTEDEMQRLRHIPATQLSKEVLKGQKDYHTVWAKDGQQKRAIFYKRPASF